MLELKFSFTKSVLKFTFENIYNYLIKAMNSRESELSGKGTWHITHELVYQWLGGLTTPFWWSDAQVNNALVKYITAYTTLKVFLYQMVQFNFRNFLTLTLGT